MEEFMLYVQWGWVAIGASGVVLFMAVLNGIDTAWWRLKNRIRGEPTPPRQRFFQALVVRPEHAEEFCRNNAGVFSADGVLKLLDRDRKPNYPDAAAFGEVLASAKAQHPGMECLFYVTRA